MTRRQTSARNRNASAPAAPARRDLARYIGQMSCELAAMARQIGASEVERLLIIAQREAEAI